MVGRYTFRILVGTLSLHTDSPPPLLVSRQVPLCSTLHYVVTAFCQSYAIQIRQFIVTASKTGNIIKWRCLNYDYESHTHTCLTRVEPTVTSEHVLPSCPLLLKMSAHLPENFPQVGSSLLIRFSTISKYRNYQL